MKILPLVSWCSLMTFSACVVDDGDSTSCTGGKCDGKDVSQTCDDPRYSDGTCDLQLDCAVPDFDCFQTFASDGDAAAWWAANQMRIAGSAFPIVAESDPRFAAVRTSLDDGWAAFRKHRPVGTLGDRRPALVIVDSPLQSAAFVAGDTENTIQPFIVFVEAATLAVDLGENPRLGVMMHELQHAVGLHLLGDGRDRVRKYYTAPAGTEPLGRSATDDVHVRRAGEAWRMGAQQVGPYASEQLGGLPTAGLFNQWLTTVANKALETNPARCTQPVQELGLVQQAILSRADVVDGSLPDLSSATATIHAALIALRDQCLSELTDDVIAVAAASAGITRAELEAQLDAHDLALMQGVHFIDGLVNLTVDRRATMREAEHQFTAATQHPFAQLRYFSFEEDADDVSAIVMRAAGLEPASMATFLAKLLPVPASTACDDAIARGFPGYGVDLDDEHHGTCWRIGHLQREGHTVGRSSVAPAASITVRIPGAFPTPRRLSDNIAN